MDPEEGLKTAVPTTPATVPDEMPAPITQVGVAAMVPVNTAWISMESPAAKLNVSVVSLHVVAGLVIVHVTDCPVAFLRQVSATELLPPRDVEREAPNPRTVPATPWKVATFASVALASDPPPTGK